MPKKISISAKERAALLAALQARFQSHVHRHPRVAWRDVQARLDAKPASLVSLRAMEQSGGEPDVIAVEAQTGECLFVDCSAQSPEQRRSLCYDRQALDARKENKPRGSAIEMAAAMGAPLLTADEYRALQDLGEFDTRTSSWVQTPDRIRALGGALFGDRRYDTVFICHNGADAYYAARGFRCSLRV